ncbi:cytochrome P450 [Favolaschia claudopus]|uniref:Cytochrome P450 n=1 Tax=Favolaschia claudopus TaxID=2862362 RepID=A0AAW0B8J6_9AGAR
MGFSLIPCASMLGLMNHWFFHTYEPSSANISFLILAIEPTALLRLIGGPFSLTRLLGSYCAFLISLSLSIVVYRISPFHPLAQYPGPVMGKATRFWGLWKAYQGYKYLYRKQLHDIYGPYVRIGPNEISINDAVAATQTLSRGGIDKGPYYTGSGKPSSITPSILEITGEAHTTRRRGWNRALASVREYEPLLSKRVTELVSLLEDNVETDLADWFYRFTVDVMGDLVYSGGFELMQNGDVTDLGGSIARYMKISDLLGQIPWSIDVLNSIPLLGRSFHGTTDYAKNLAIRRIKNGSGDLKDLYYHLASADEGGHETKKPAQEIAAADSLTAIVAASDTSTTTMTSVVWFLLSHPAYYQRVQEELDRVIPSGDNLPDSDKQSHLHFVTACINESLRLHPPLPSGGTRKVPMKAGGRSIAGRFVPEGTSIAIPCYSLHRNPEYFSYPDQFLPERWLPDSKLERHNVSAFMPFSIGPATCAGQKFAKLELTMVLSALFRCFDLKFADGFDSEDWPRGMKDHFVVTRGPLHVRLTRRSNGYI